MVFGDWTLAIPYLIFNPALQVEMRFGILNKKQDRRPVLQAPYRQMRKANSVLGEHIICGTVWIPKVLETNLKV